MYFFLLQFNCLVIIVIQKFFFLSFLHFLNHFSNFLIESLENSLYLHFQHYYIWEGSGLLSLCSTVEPLNKGHIGIESTVPWSTVNKGHIGIRSTVPCRMANK